MIGDGKLNLDGFTVRTTTSRMRWRHLKRARATRRKTFDPFGTLRKCDMQELVRVAHQSSLWDSTPVCVQHKGVPYCVVRMQDEITAYITICSHEEKAFTPEMIDRCLVCPFHRVYFDASSGEVRDRNGKNVPKGLARVSTETRDGYIYVVSEDAHFELLAKSDARRQERSARKRSWRRWFSFLRKVSIRWRQLKSK